MDAPHQPLTFIVRVTPGDDGMVSGTVERVRSGEKQRFEGFAALAKVIAAITERETALRRQQERLR